MNEHQIQVNIMKWLSLQHKEVYDLCYAVPNGGARHAGTGRKLKAEGVKAGVPDICIAYPSKGFHGLYIELKKEGGRLTKYQAEWLDKLTKQGYMAVVCIGFDAAVETINGYLSE